MTKLLNTKLKAFELCSNSNICIVSIEKRISVQIKRRLKLGEYRKSLVEMSRDMEKMFENCKVKYSLLVLCPYNQCRAL